MQTIKQRQDLERYARESEDCGRGTGVLITELACLLGIAALAAFCYFVLRA